MTIFDVTSTETETKGLDEMISLDGNPWRFYIKPLMDIESNDKIIASNVKSNNETRLAAAESNITSLSNGKANSSHTHTLSEITDYTAPDLTSYATTSAMNTALAGKSDTSHNHDSSYASSSHTHTLNDITDYSAPDLTPYATTSAMNTALSGKADSSHNHDSSYSAINHNHDTAYSALGHTHTLSDITNYSAPDLTPYATTSAMNTALSGKANSSHTHELDDVILTYEEEEETNGETSTITKTKTLPQVLNNCAKLDTENLFTEMQKISLNNTNNECLRLLNTQGYPVRIWFGSKNVSSFSIISYEPNYEELRLNNNANIPVRI